jgi:hypothetical protein
MAVKRYNGTSWDTVAGLGAQGAAATSSSIVTWVKTAAGGETSLTGSSDSSTTLAYTAGQEQLFINGVLQVRGSDYTATNGTSITGLTALTAGDIATVTTVNAFSVTGAVPLSTVTANGDLIVGTSSGAVGRLGIGSTDQVLKVSGGVPVWATPAAGGAYTLLASGSITNGLSLTSISGSYTDLYLVLTNFAPTVTDIIGVRINNDATTANYVGGIVRDITGTGPSVQANSWAFVDVNSNSSVKQATTGNSAFLYFSNYANTTGYKIVTADGGANNNLSTYTSGHNTVTYLSTSAITRLDLKTAGSDWANQGTYVLYGVK